MDTRPRTTPRTYEDFQPSFEWDKEDGHETLVISLPGFTREQLKVQMDNLGNLKIGGERPLAGERWSRFRKDFRVPKGTSNADIRAKLENGNLYVIFPKLFARPHRPDQPTMAVAPEPGKKTMPEPKAMDDQGSKNQRDSRISSSSSDGAAMNQSNGRNRINGEPTYAANNEKRNQEQNKDQSRKSEEKQDASEIGKKDDELANARKRKATVVDEETASAGGGSGVPKPAGSGLEARFKKPRQLMLNVGVAAVILVGLILCVSFKLRKSMEADSN